jgi:hypothetical protein
LTLGLEKAQKSPGQRLHARLKLRVNPAPMPQGLRRRILLVPLAMRRRILLELHRAMRILQVMAAREPLLLALVSQAQEPQEQLA